MFSWRLPLHERIRDGSYSRPHCSLLASGSVQATEYVYPKYEIPLLEAYCGQFESVFIVLHPFIRVPEALGWAAAQRYPDDSQILGEGKKCSWSEVSKQIGISSYARMNQALLTSIGSLADYLADWAGRDAIAEFVKAQAVWMPTEGRFEPLLQRDFLDVFEAAGAAELVFVPEFPNADPVVQLSVDWLKGGASAGVDASRTAGLESGATRQSAIPFPARGTLLAPDRSFLFTVDWDSLFTLFYGPRGFVEEEVRRLRLEGFFATANTDHAWFNYSFGCAVVTVSPEDCASYSTS
jgi:hypothetical protein